MLKNKNKNKKADSAGHTLGDRQGLGLDARERRLLIEEERASLRGVGAGGTRLNPAGSFPKEHSGDP